MIKPNIEKAVAILRRGGVVAIPTETVYGLGADASSAPGLQKIFQLKQRPIDHPLIVHLGSIDALTLWARDVPEVALRLAGAFWPGPLTLIFKKQPQVLDWVTGGQDTVGIRIPSHPVALAVLKAQGGGIAAPSANRFGRISPTTAQAVYEELGDAVDLILDGGQCEVGVESTIVDVSRTPIRILRPGMISVQAIEAVLGEWVGITDTSVPRVSGSHESHYAPTTQTRLLSYEDIEHYLAHYSNQLPVAIMAFSEFNVSTSSLLQVIAMPKTPTAYAHQLYQQLRELDKKNVYEIIIENVPNDSLWDAIRDRLTRASVN